MTQHYEAASGQESTASDNILTGQLQWMTAVPTWRLALQQCADWSGRVPGAAQLSLPALAKSARTMRPAHALQRPVSTTAHATQLDQTVCGVEERAEVQLPVVGRQRGGYSHQPADSSAQPMEILPPTSKRENHPPRCKCTCQTRRASVSDPAAFR